MSIDRISTAAQTAYFLNQIQNAGVALDKTQAQIASGYNANNYAGFGGQTQVFSTDITAGRQGNLAAGDDHPSSHHARFQFAHGYWYVEDLNSTNGTWLNGRRMFSAQRLKKGDKVRIGRTTVTIVSA